LAFSAPLKDAMKQVSRAPITTRTISGFAALTHTA
jgi:hypothetical protein